MLRNYFKVIARSFIRNRFYSVLNTAGLAIGFAAFILIAIFLHYETNFERFHSKADRIYRVSYRYQSANGFNVQWARIPVNYINELPNEFPEIKRLIRFQNHERKFIRIGEEKFRPEHIYITDKEVFEVFDFKLMYGNPNTALSQPHSVVITESLARKYFKTTDCLGQELHVTGTWSPDEVTYEITGIMKDLPSNTHLPVDILISMKDEADRTGWAYIYTLLEDGADLSDLESKMPGFIEKYTDEDRPGGLNFVFQPLKDIHLKSNLAREIVPNGNEFYVKVFFFVGIFILLIALVNFMNLNLAMSIARSKEVGLRTVLGSGKEQVVMYFLAESIFYNMLAMLTGGFLAYLAFPRFRTLTGADFLINPWSLTLCMFLMALICGLLSGVYPARALTKFNAMEVLRNSRSFNFSGKKSSFSTRRILVALQFSISIILMGSAIIASHQFEYLNKKNLGLEKEQVLAVYGAGDAFKNDYKNFKDRLNTLPGVISVTACMEVPSVEIRDAGPVLLNGVNMEKDQAPIMDIQIIDHDFIETMGLTLLAGENLPRSIRWDTIPDFSDNFTLQDYLINQRRAYLINETAMRKLGWKEPEAAIGHEISWSIGSFELAMGPITGVVKDYHQETLKNIVDPTVMVFEPIWMSTFLAKIETERVQSTVGNIKAIWDDMFPSFPTEYYFLDDMYHDLYKTERVQLQLLYVLSGLAILIAFIGLFGLIAYALKTRIKEIAIRKVLGATVFSLIHLISAEYFIVMIIGGVIAVPLSYLWINRWLQNFAYRIEISPMNYVVTLLLVGILLLATIGVQVIRGALINPADTLRNE